MDYINIRGLCRLIFFAWLAISLACVDHSQNVGGKEGVSDCLNLETCPDLDGVVPVGGEDRSREGQPGSEKYKESPDSLAAIFKCQEAEVFGAGGETVIVRSSLDPNFSVLDRVSEGTRLQVLEVERQGPQINHDQEALRRSSLWYKVSIDVKNQNSGWLTAVYTRCSRM